MNVHSRTCNNAKGESRRDKPVLVNQKLAQSQVGRSLLGTGAAETHKTTVIVKHERAEAETKSGGWPAYATRLKL